MGSAMSIGTLTTLAESTEAVLVAGRKIRDGHDDPARVEYATELLAERLEASVTALAPAPVQAFDTLGPTERAESADDALTIAASQLSMAVVALAADAERGRRPADGSPTSALDTALGDLTAINSTVKDLVAPAPRLGFQTAARSSADLAAAVKNLTGTTESTLSNISTKGAELCERVVKALPEVVPAIQKSWDAIKDALHLDAVGDQLSRLTRAALRLLAAALGRLAALIPGSFMEGARDRLQALATRLERDEPAVAVFGSVLGVDGLQRDLGVRLTREGLDKSKLDRGAGQVSALAERYGRYIGVAATVAAALKVLHSFSGALIPIVPQFAVMTASAHVLVLVAVVAISLDFLDTGPQIGVVRGVRLTIQDATE
jgi:hypothetical protein